MIINPTMQEIGRAVRLERERRGWSRPDLAKHCDGIGTGMAVQKIENGEMGSMRSMLAISDAFGMPLATLLISAGLLALPEEEAL